MDHFTDIVVCVGASRHPSRTLQLHLRKEALLIIHLLQTVKVGILIVVFGALDFISTVTAVNLLAAALVAHNYYYFFNLFSFYLNLIYIEQFNQSLSSGVFRIVVGSPKYWSYGHESSSKVSIFSSISQSSGNPISPKRM